MDGIYDILNSDQNCLLKGGVHSPYTGKCYTFSSTKLAWDDTRAECHKNGGDLATIANQATLDFIVSNFKISEYSYFGGYQSKKGVWSWADGSPWTGFGNWATGDGKEPSVNGDAYTVIKVDTWYYNTEGSKNYFYLCQY